MGHDDKPTANVRDIERAGLEYSDDKGQTHTYSHASTLWLNIRQLQERVTMRPPDANHQEPWVERAVIGVAELDRDRSISVVGAPHTLTATLPLTIRPGPWQSRPKRKTDAELFELGDGVGWGSIGFLARDWEIGNEDAWYLECYTSDTVLQGLLDAVSTGRAVEGTLGLRLLRGLYQDEGDYAPPSARRHLFLRPDRDRNRTTFPESANGDLSGINLVLATPSIPLNTPSPPKDDEDIGEPPETTPPSVVIEGMPDHVGKIIAAVESLRGTLKWLIAAAFLASVALFGRY